MYSIHITHTRTRTHTHTHTYQLVLYLLYAFLSLLAVLLATGDGNLVAVLTLRGKINASACLLPNL